MAEVSQTKSGGSDDDVSATPNDPRVEWRKYKFIPYPQRNKPRSNFCDKITFGYMSKVAKDGFYRPPLNFKDVYLAPYYHSEKLFRRAKLTLRADMHHKSGSVTNFQFLKSVLSLETRMVFFTISLNFFDMLAEAVRPVILKHILYELNGNRDTRMLLFLSIAMFIASLCVGIGHSQYLNAANNLLGLRWNGSLSSLIFSKMLRAHSQTAENGLNLIIGDCKILADASLWAFRFPGFLTVIIYSITMLFFEIGVAPVSTDKIVHQHYCSPQTNKGKIYLRVRVLLVYLP